MGECEHFGGWQGAGEKRWGECGYVFPDGKVGGACGEARTYPSGAPMGEISNEGCLVYQHLRVEVLTKQLAGAKKDAERLAGALLVADIGDYGHEERIPQRGCRCTSCKALRAHDALKEKAGG